MLIRGWGWIGFRVGGDVVFGFQCLANRSYSYLFYFLDTLLYDLNSTDTGSNIVMQNSEKSDKEFK